jgi:peptide/nickel transport system substrate-binding protein
MRLQKPMIRGRMLAAGIVVGLVVAACAPAEDPEGAVGEPIDDEDTVEEPGDPTPGGSVTVGLEAESAGWAPWSDSWSPPGWMAARSFYDTLMDRDENGEPQPFLAESFEPNDDFTEYTLTLREGVEFHDGEALNAEAVVANIEKHREPGAVTGAAVAPIEDVTAEDELTVIFTLDQPHVAFADYYVGQAGVMVSPASIEDESASTEPVGTGPFVFENWQRDQQLEVSRNDDYWMEDRPYLDEVTFRPIPDEDARLQSLFSGDVDVMQTLRQSIVTQAQERGDDYNLYEAIGNNSGATILNTAVPPFDDERVREAWAYSINQDELIEVLGGTGISPPARGVFNPNSPWFNEEMDDVWPSEDLDRAQAALDEYVDDPDRSDGEEPGTPVSFEFDTPPDPSLLETSSVYQANVGRIGFEMDIQTVEQAVHIQQAVGDAPEFVGDFQAKIWRVGEEADPDWMVPSFAEGSPVNFTNYNNEEMFGLLIQARQTPEFEDRRDLYHQVQQILAEDNPFTLTGHTFSLIGTDPDVYGFDSWELPDGEPGVGHPESIARWHSVWMHQE